MKEWRMEGGRHKCEVCSTVGFLRVKRTNILILLLTGFGSVGLRGCDAVSQDRRGLWWG